MKARFSWGSEEGLSDEVNTGSAQMKDQKALVKQKSYIRALHTEKIIFVL